MTVKLKKYVVSVSDYMGDSPSMHTITAEDDNDAILTVFPDDFDEIGEDGGDMAIDDYIKCVQDSNGDGQPYIMIFSIEADKVIFGG